MREIKFRAWDKKSNRFINHEEYVFISSNGRPTVFDSSDCGKDGLHEHDVTDEFDLNIQFSTGLQDSRGDDIYEGDILRPIILNGTITDGEVKFTWGCFVVKQIGADGFFDNLSAQNPEGNCQIVGNIHENSELLNDNVG